MALTQQEQEVLEKAAQAGENAAKTIAEFEAKDAEFQTKAASALGAVAARGIIRKTDIDGYLKKLAEDKRAVFDMLESLADRMATAPVPALGKVSEKRAAADTTTYDCSEASQAIARGFAEVFSNR
jgi:hypothetical protein